MDSISITLSKISSIEIDTGLIGTSITIKSYGSAIIHAKNFTKSDAREIKKILDSLM